MNFDISIWLFFIHTPPLCVEIWTDSAGRYTECCNPFLLYSTSDICYGFPCRHKLDTLGDEIKEKFRSLEEEYR